MQISPYLNFNGHCEAAFKFYEKVFGGKINALISHAGTPTAETVPADRRSKIMHSHLNAGDQVVMGSDAPPGHFQKPQGIAVSLQIKSPSEAERIFHAMSEGGKGTMAIQETFRAARFGMFVDRFGIPWMVKLREGSVTFLAG